ncbi:MAG: hypothetical protein IPG92_13050 [Flavobacteriales bacterium]|nr:hypothetical protein [Flavobacteriales bacterium]
MERELQVRWSAVIDCEGVAGGTDLPGTPCDDGLATTGNDTWSANCTCVGQLIDCEGVAGGTDLPGTPCDDGLATTGNDTWSANCTCVGQVIDCEGVAGGTDLPGTPCDDENPNTSGDTWSANCACIGTPIGGCDHEVNLDIWTDDNGDETTWEIIPQGGGSPTCSGGPYVGLDNDLVNASCCLSTGCYVLRVLDSAGDGISTGGYVLTTSSGARIIDNRYDGSGFTDVSQIANGGGFCVPIGTDRLISTSCDKIFWTVGEYIVANDNAAVALQWQQGIQTDDGYEMWFFNPNGGYSFRRFHSHAVSDGFGPARRLTRLPYQDQQLGSC